MPKTMRGKIYIVIVLAVVWLTAIVLSACAKPASPDQSGHLVTISFDTKGGSPVAAIRIPAGSKLTLPDDPVREEYVFDGWHLDADCTRDFNPNLFETTRDTTLYAGWVSVKLIPHAVSVGSLAGGSIAVLSGGTAIYGREVSFRITPDSGYRLIPDSIYLNGIPYGEFSGRPYQDDYLFIMPAEPVVITAEFEAIVYSVAIGESEGGRVLCDRSTATVGETIYLQIVPDPGYKLQQLFVNGAELAETSFEMPAANVTIYATFVPFDDTLYTISVNNEGLLQGGTVHADLAKAKEGEYVRLSAQPIDGMRLVEYRVNDLVVREDYFVMPACDVVVYGVFRSISTLHRYPLTLSVDRNRGYAEANGTEFAAGERVTLTVRAYEGYYFSRLKVNGSPIDGMTFLMPEESVEVTVELLPRDVYSVIIDPVRGGTLRVAYDEVGVAGYRGAKVGSIVTVLALPDEGYRLKEGSLSVNGSPIEAGYFVMPDAEARISAVFEAISYGDRPLPIIVEETEGGRIEAPQSALGGKTVSVRVIPDAGYRLQQGSLCYNGVPFEGQFEMPYVGSIALTCRFERVFAIESYCDQTIGVYAAVTEAASGERVAVELLLPYDLRLSPEDIVVKGRDDGARYEILSDAGGYYFIMPSCDVALEPSMTPSLPDTDTRYRVATEASAGGAVEAPFAGGYFEGQTVSLQCLPKSGFRLASVSVEDKSGTVIGNSTTFRMPAHDVIVKAVFEETEEPIALKELYGLYGEPFARLGIALRYLGSGVEIADELATLDLTYLAPEIDSILLAEIGVGVKAFVIDGTQNASLAFVSQRLLAALRSRGNIPDAMIAGGRLVVSIGDTAKQCWALLHEGIIRAGDFVFAPTFDGEDLCLYRYLGSQAVVRIPDTVEGRAVTTVAPYAFENCDFVSAIDLGQISVLSDFALCGLTGVKHLDLSSVRSIGTGALLGMTSLESFYVSEYNRRYTTSIGASSKKNILYSKDYTRLIAFAVGSDITRVSPDARCLTIGEYAFFGSKITSFSFNNVLSVETSAFEHCDVLATLEGASIVRSIGDRAFYGVGAVRFWNLVGLQSIGTEAFRFDRDAGTDVQISFELLPEAEENPIVMIGTGEAKLTIVSYATESDIAGHPVWSFYADCFRLN